MTKEFCQRLLVVLGNIKEQIARQRYCRLFSGEEVISTLKKQSIMQFKNKIILKHPEITICPYLENSTWWGLIGDGDHLPCNRVLCSIMRVLLHYSLTGFLVHGLLMTMNQSLPPLLSMHSSASSPGTAPISISLTALPRKNPASCLLMPGAEWRQDISFVSTSKYRWFCLFSLWTIGAWGLDKPRRSLNRK